MSTIDSESIIREIIAANGYYEDDPRVALIVEYTNHYGNRTWGVTWSNESPNRITRYLIDSEYIIDPVILADYRVSEKQ